MADNLTLGEISYDRCYLNDDDDTYIENLFEIGLRMKNCFLFTSACAFFTLCISFFLGCFFANFNLDFEKELNTLIKDKKIISTKEKIKRNELKNFCCSYYFNCGLFGIQRVFKSKDSKYLIIIRYYVLLCIPYKTIELWRSSGGQNLV